MYVLLTPIRLESAVRYFAYALLVLACAGTVYLTYWYARSRWLYEYLFGLMAVAYLLGQGLQGVPLGPELVRFWLADAAFASAWAYMLVGARQPPRGLMSGPSLEYRLKVVRLSQKVLVAMLLFAYVFESLSHYIVAFERRYMPDNPLPSGGFDWWDMLAYTVGAAIGMWLLQEQATWLISRREWVRSFMPAPPKVGKKPKVGTKQPGHKRRRRRRR